MSSSDLKGLIKTINKIIGKAKPNKAKPKKKAPKKAVAKKKAVKKAAAKKMSAKKARQEKIDPKTALNPQRTEQRTDRGFR